MKGLVRIIAFMVIFLGGESFANCALGVNILNNSSFEDASSLDNWSKISGSADIIRSNYSTGWAGDTPSGAGSFFLHATGGNSVTIVQTVDISSCMGSDREYDFSAFLGGYGDGDNVSVKLDFKENDNIVKSYSTEEFTSSKKMKLFTKSDSLSSNIDSVTVILTFNRVAGNDIDGYVDSLSIVIREATPPNSCTLGTNIFSKGSFESIGSLNNWTKISGEGDITRANYSTGWAGSTPSGAGSYFLHATGGSSVTVEQTVDISSCMSEDRDYDFSTFLGGYGDGDSIAVKLDFKDESNNILKSYNTGDVTSSKEMKLFSSSDSLSSDIKKLTVSLTFKRVSGNDIDGYVDGLSLIIKEVEPTPTPTPVSCTLGTNIINDGSFENASSLDSWTKISGSADINQANYSTGWAGDAPNEMGSYFLYAINGDTVVVERTIDISNCMDGNIKYYDFSSFLGGYGDGDSISLKIDFKEDDDILKTYSIKDFASSSKEMKEFINYDSVPNEVNKITVTLTFKRVTGNDIDGYIDGLSIILRDTPPLEIVSPENNYIQTDTNISIKLNSISLNEGWGVKTILDEGTDIEQIKIVDTLPYSANFDNISVGEHTIDVYIVDENGVVKSGDKKHDRVTNIGIGGDIIVAIGDSITEGYKDDDDSDDTSNDGRNSGGGYPPILNDILTQRLNKPHSIYNEGVGGDIAEEGLTRLKNILNTNKYPNATKYLVMFGTNDATWKYTDNEEYKDIMQQMIDLIKNSGKTPILARIPRVLGERTATASYEEDGVNPEDGLSNKNIKEYNNIIDELIAENDLISPPEFYSYFRDTYGDSYSKEEQDGYGDNLHPDGLGYRDMANIWGDILAP